MKIQFLGTAAAEGWPAIFCRCPSCLEAIRRGGKNIRTRSSLLIDGWLMVDLPPDTYKHVLDRQIDLSAIAHLLITHTHEDHFYPLELMNRKEGFAYNTTAPCLHVYGNDAMAATGNRLKEEADCSDARLMFHEVPAFIPFRAGDAVVTPLLANHNRKERCYLYIVESGGKRLFISYDTGIYPDETWAALSGLYFDAAIIECTCGDEKEGYNHMGMEDDLEVQRRLTGMGCINESSRLFLTHFSHNGHLLHEELEAAMGPHGFSVAYDGETVEI